MHKLLKWHKSLFHFNHRLVISLISAHTLLKQKVNLFFWSDALPDKQTYRHLFATDLWIN